MAERAVQAERQVHGSIGLRPALGEVRNLEWEIYARKVRESPGSRSRPLDLLLRNVESARGNPAEFERMCVHDQSAQPGAGTTTRIENPDRACTGSPQVGQFPRQYLPDATIRVGVHSLEGKWLRRIAISIGDIIVTGLIIDIRNVGRWLTIKDKIPASRGNRRIQRP